MKNLSKVLFSSFLIFSLIFTSVINVFASNIAIGNYNNTKWSNFGSSYGDYYNLYHSIEIKHPQKEDVLSGEVDVSIYVGNNNDAVKELKIQIKRPNHEALYLATIDVNDNGYAFYKLDTTNLPNDRYYLMVTASYSTKYVVVYIDNKIEPINQIETVKNQVSKVKDIIDNTKMSIINSANKINSLKNNNEEQKANLIVNTVGNSLFVKEKNGQEEVKKVEEKDVETNNQGEVKKVEEKDVETNEEKEVKKVEEKTGETNNQGEVKKVEEEIKKIQNADNKDIISETIISNENKVVYPNYTKEEKKEKVLNIEKNEKEIKKVEEQIESQKEFIEKAKGGVEEIEQALNIITNKVVDKDDKNNKQISDKIINSVIDDATEKDLSNVKNKLIEIKQNVLNSEKNNKNINKQIELIDEKITSNKNDNKKVVNLDDNEKKDIGDEKIISNDNNEKVVDLDDSDKKDTDVVYEINSETVAKNNNNSVVNQSIVVIDNNKVSNDLKKNIESVKNEESKNNENSNKSSEITTNKINKLTNSKIKNNRDELKNVQEKKKEDKIKEQEKKEKKIIFARFFPNNNTLIDSDSDGLSDSDERKYGTDPLNPDSDNDGYLDGVEVGDGNNPNGNGKLANNPNIISDDNKLLDNIVVDSDGDGLTDNEETIVGTDPFNPDSDNDGKLDGEEINYGTNPLDGNIDDKIEYEGPKTAGVVYSDIFQVLSVANSIEKEEVINEKFNGGISTSTTSIVATSTGQKEAVKETKTEKRKKIEFKGKAIPNSFVVLYVYSEKPIVITVRTDENGNWEYKLDKTLRDGQHEVYVAVTNNSGKIVAKSEPFSFFVKKALAVTNDTQFRTVGMANVESTTDLMSWEYTFFFGVLVLLSFILVIIFFFYFTGRVKL